MRRSIRMFRRTESTTSRFCRVFIRNFLRQLASAVSSLCWFLLWFIFCPIFLWAMGRITVWSRGWLITRKVCLVTTASWRQPTRFPQTGMSGRWWNAQSGFILAKLAKLWKRASVHLAILLSGGRAFLLLLWYCILLLSACAVLSAVAGSMHVIAIVPAITIDNTVFFKFVFI